MSNIQPTVDALDQPTVMLQIRKIAGTVDSNLEAVNNEMANIQEQINHMEDVSGRVTTLENEMDTVQSDLTAVENKNTEQDSAISDNTKGLITASELTYAEGVLTLKLTKQNGNLIETVDVPFFKTVTLIPTSTERAFKLQFTMWDDSVYDTNEFVIPAGGGTDVSVTGVTVGEGASDNTFKVSIQLSDASTIASNDYPFPASVTNPYPIDVKLSLSDNTLNCDITLSDSNHVDGSVDLTNLLSSYATTEDLSDLQEQVTGLKLTTEGNNITLNGDSVQIVKTVTGSVSGNNLTIGVNGINSSAIKLPSGDTENGWMYFGKSTRKDFMFLMTGIDHSDDTSPKQYPIMQTGKINGISSIKINNIMVDANFSGDANYIIKSIETGDSFNTLGMVLPDKYYTYKKGNDIIKGIDGIYNSSYNYIKIKNIGLASTGTGGIYSPDNNYICDCIINLTESKIKINKKAYSIHDDNELQLMLTPMSKAEIYTTEPTFD